MTPEYDRPVLGSRAAILTSSCLQRSIEVNRSFRTYLGVLVITRKVLLQHLADIIIYTGDLLRYVLDCSFYNLTGNS